MIETDGIRTRLLADSAVRALVGHGARARCYPIVLPQDAEYPALTFQRISGVRELTHDGPDGVPWMRLQVDTWATTYAAAKALAKAVRECLDGFSGHVGDEHIKLAQLLSERDLYETATALYRVSLDFGVHYTESVGR